MAVPDYQSLMLPLLKHAGARNDEVTTSDAVEVLAQELNLTEEDLREMLPSGVQSTLVLIPLDGDMVQHSCIVK
jgi:restriction system protein